MGWVTLKRKVSFFDGHACKFCGMRFFLFFFLSLVMSCVWLTGAEARGVAHDFPGTLSLHKGRLTAKLSAVSLRQVMEEIGELSGAEIVWLQKNAGGMVSANFSEVPFTRALRLLLGKRNFLLFYSSEEGESQLSQIWISNGSGAPTVTAKSKPVNLGKLLRWYRTALRGASAALRLQAVQNLQQQAPINARAKRMLANIARAANDPQVRQAAAATIQARK